MTTINPMLEKMAEAMHERHQQARPAIVDYVAWDDLPQEQRGMLFGLARAALTALRDLTPEAVEATYVASAVALAEHGIPPDVQELLVRGDGRGTIAPHALRKAAIASHTAIINHILGEG